MIYLLIAAFILFVVAFIRVATAHGNDDFGSGFQAIILFGLAVLMLIIDAIWWIASHFTYIGGA